MRTSPKRADPIKCLLMLNLSGSTLFSIGKRSEEKEILFYLRKYRGWSLDLYNGLSQVYLMNRRNRINHKWAATWDFQKYGICDQLRLKPACAYALFAQSICLWLEYSMTVRLLTEHHLEFRRWKGGFTGSSESTLGKMPYCGNHMSRIKCKKG